MKFIDTHCHLEMDQFDGDREEVIKRAFDAGFEALITIASDPESNEQAIALAHAHDNIYCTVGVHPHEARFVDNALLDKIRAWAKDEKVVAIGETGLDYHYDNSPREKQREVFRAHLKIARETNLPVVIHVREADADAIEILKEERPERAVLHCYSGSAELLELASEMGIYISIAGPVTFKKALELKEAVRRVPDELLLLETDAPYLAPVPKRGKRNEPEYLINTAREVASLRGVTLEDIARITTINAKRIFGIGELPGQGEVAYKIRNSLYLNITNRCTNRCGFCVRSTSDFVKGHNLRLVKEPTIEEVKAAIGNPAEYDEIVFCGYGEPLIRLDEVKDIARWVKEKGGRVRVNSNGHGNHIHKRNIVPELVGIVDEYSISLDAQDSETYDSICLPSFKGAYDAVLEFIEEAAKETMVKVTVVSAEGVDIDKCRAIAEGLGAELRVRKLDVVG
jgi:TatD DNase family protein